MQRRTRRDTFNPPGPKRTRMTADAWFSGLDPETATDEGAAAIRDGRADDPADWPAEAVTSGFATDEAAYYDRLRAAAIAAARAETERRERADDRQLAHAVRAMDDIAR